MRSHAAAFGMQILRRHRWGLTAVVSYLLLLAIFRLLVLLSGEAVFLDDPLNFAFAVVVPLSSIFMYLLAVFTFGLTGDLAARESMYPARMFTLPVTSIALAGWPMLYGTAIMALLWLVTRSLVIWPADLEVPLLWPAMLAAAILAWMQALTWMPYPLRGLRVPVAVVVVVMIDVVVIPALHYKASELVMLAILTPNFPLAYFTARFAVERARRGDVTDSRGLFTRLRPAADILSGTRERFRSLSGAQAWYEWRLHGRSLPVLVAILLPFELSFLFFFRETPAIIFETLVAVLLTPPFMAVFVAATFSKTNVYGSDSYGMAPFIATRPLTSASLIAVKLKVTIRSTLVAWLLVIVAVLSALKLSGTWSLVVKWAGDVVEVVGKARAIAFVLLGFSTLVASTWKQLVLSLCIGLSGREWVVKGSAFLALSFLAVIVPVVQWILTSNRLVAMLWAALPWIIAVLAFFKISAAAWIVIRLYDRRLLRDRTLILGAACWTVAVFALYGIFVWLVSTMLIPGYVLALVAILLVPLVRLSAAPLALAWNRSR